MQRRVNTEFDFDVLGQACWIVRVFDDTYDEDPAGELVFRFQDDAKVAVRKWLNGTAEDFESLRLTMQQEAVV